MPCPTCHDDLLIRITRQKWPENTRWWDWKRVIPFADSIWYEEETVGCHTCTSAPYHRCNHCKGTGRGEDGLTCECTDPVYFPPVGSAAGYYPTTINHPDDTWVVDTNFNPDAFDGATWTIIANEFSNFSTSVEEHISVLERVKKLWLNP